MAELHRDFEAPLGVGVVDDAPHAAVCASFQRPVQPGEMRASGETPVISVKISPAPPIARAP
ncbi:MAG: hypothetical protein U0326_05670 [Polyangiales bacterium]